ncbi:ribosome biogenesis protein tsr1 [Vararia minispora EC-137]|uniref:Ribosome biogenesis protein tsr1 n=1 Tax=Vararia minispora EC-137 TaxID=1314806 RepID=A0ACB8QML3_9AGAM|nr:ribosome biogenesis protein tsr1 [Vararia minispora EC-137]
MPEAFHHRSTLKQTNKPFKSRHATKSSLKDLAKGRVPRQSPKVSHAAAAVAQSKQSRRNTAKQAQAVKRHALVTATRVFGGADGAPRVVAIVPLTEDVDAHAVARAVAEAVGVDDEAAPKRGLWRIRAERFKTALQFIQVPYGRTYAALDAAKAADYVVLALSPSIEVPPAGDTLLRALQAQGLPSILAAVAPGFSPDPKTRPGILKSLLSFVRYFAPDQARVFDLNAPADRLTALRALAEGRPREVRWREGRAWVLAEDVAWDDGRLAVTGVVRGRPLSANRLVHLPNFGDFQIAKIESAPLPRRGQAMDVEPAVLGAPDDDADSLVSSNDPDDLANEQTWPTEEEMRGVPGPSGGEPGDALPDAENTTTPKAVRRIPKGMSEYQSSWIIENDDDDEDDEDDGGEGDGDAAMEEEGTDDAPVEDEEMEADSRRSVQFEELDADEEERQLDKWRNRKREEEDDLEFPDEIDTPQDVPARERFQRYRGLRSFRTSPWDPYENLPRDYARIFQFEDYRRTERMVLRRAERDAAAVQSGTRVTIILKDVPREAADVDPTVPLAVFGLHQHEHKKTVLNFAVQRNTEYDESVRSKDPLILCVGPRRLRVNPIYSQHMRGGGKGANNVHKFERYLRQGHTYVATVFGPVVFGSQPCMLLRETRDAEAPELVATGSFLHPDPTRIVAKRIILSGHPFKVHKKTATVRYMFFNADDVLYYKPVQLHTKYGRTGHIRESLGTHGYFKAHFDGPINQMDTVTMALYKRVFPRWSELYREAPAAVDWDGDGDAMQE